MNVWGVDRLYIWIIILHPIHCLFKLFVLQAYYVHSFATIGMRETVRDVETGEKRLGNSEY